MVSGRGYEGFRSCFNDIQRLTEHRDQTGFQLTLQPPANSNLTWQNGQMGNTVYMKAGNDYALLAEYKGCLHQTNMKVIAKALPRFNLGNDTTLCKGYDLPLHGSYPGAAYKWNTGSTDSFITATTRGLYWASASLNGCQYKDSIIFDQKTCDCNIIMPNAFSPNGDGMNDVYHPYIKCFPRSYELIFYSRYGQQVFASKDFKKLWDGRLNNSLLPAGTYYYILNFYNEDLQRNERRSGSVTLLR